MIIADDHELMLEGIRTLLERNGEFEVIATASDGDSALREIASLQPEIAIIDAILPGKSGIEVISEASLTSANTAFVMISMFDHIHLISDAKAAGAAACVSKNDAAIDLVVAIESIGSGTFFVSRSMATEWESLGQSDSFVPLSSREREVMGAIVSGSSNKEIAAQLQLSVRTVDHHRERMMRKIGARNAADVVRYAARKGDV